MRGWRIFHAIPGEMQSNSNFAEVVRFDCLLLTSAGLATQVGPDLSHPTLILSSKDTTNKSSIEMRGKSWWRGHIEGTTARRLCCQTAVIARAARHAGGVKFSMVRITPLQLMWLRELLQDVVRCARSCRRSGFLESRVAHEGKKKRRTRLHIDGSPRELLIYGTCELHSPPLNTWRVLRYHIHPILLDHPWMDLISIFFGLD